MPRIELPLIDGPIRFEGAVDFLQQCGGVIPLRMPAPDMALGFWMLVRMAATACGVRLELVSDTRSLRIEGQQIRYVGVAVPAYEVVVDGTSVGVRSVRSAGPFAIEFELPPGRKNIQVWLPMGAMVCVRSVSIDPGALAEPASVKKPRWVVYGSSIVHCPDAAAPTAAWPIAVAVRYGLDLVNLGFAGSCHNDISVARLIRDAPADLIALELGINVTQQGSFNSRTFLPSVLGFIQTIRERHGTTPIFVISPIFQGELDEQVGPSGLRLGEIRMSLARLVRQLRAMGDENIRYVHGLELLGPNDGRLLIRRHPTAKGNAKIAAAFAHQAFRPNGLLGAALRRSAT